jgi:short-subunit dehydrogenase
MSDARSATAAGHVRPLAVVTGASSGIGFELAKLFAEDGYDLVVAADTPLAEAVQALQGLGAQVDAVQVDLASEEGVQSLYKAIAGRSVEALAANAGHGLGKAFLDQDFDDIVHVINTNITGCIRLTQLLGREMRERGGGRILFTGSIAGLMPGSFQAVYNGTKAFVDSFSFALRNELKDTGVSVTVLMPGPTETHFFKRGNLSDTKVGQDLHKADPADVAKAGYEAMKKGQGDVVAGLGNKIQAAMAAVTPQSVLAERHRKMAEPGSGA